VDEDGDAHGYQATFFRLALTPGEPAGRSPFAAREAIVFHGSVTDVARQTFTFDQDGERAAAGWASASAERLDVHVFERRLRELAPDRWELSARVAGWRLDLSFALDGPVVLHGDGGLSQKGPEPGQASHHVSRPRLTTTGTLTRPDGRRLAVRGESWFDQEIGTAQLAPSQVGWDWFSARLGDGSALMAYRLLEEDGSASASSSGTWVAVDGTTRHLTRDDVRVETTARWTSPETGVTWPAGWTIEVPSLGLELTVTPEVADQEMRTAATTGVTYWEGLCRYVGRREGRPVAGHGHVELVGHGGAVPGLRGSAP
jgi:predicted secreted hydrolase